MEGIMRLYFSPLACSLATRMAVYEAGLPASFHKVTLSTKTLDDGTDYRAVAPKGQVPALVLDDGMVLTEGSAVLQYVADQAPSSGLAPAAGTIERYQVQQWLSFVATEIHKQVFAAIFNPASPDEARGFARSLLPAKLAYVDDHLNGRDYLVGDSFTVADAYLAWVLVLAPRLGIDLAQSPSLAAYAQRIHARPHVARAIGDEMSLLG
jgi:glutathione S-transferase